MIKFYKLGKYIVVFLTISFLINMLTVVMAVDENLTKSEVKSASIDENDSYSSYYNKNKSINKPIKSYNLNFDNLTEKSANVKILDEYYGKAKVLKLNEGDFANWNFEASDDGLFLIFVEYIALSDEKNEAQAQLEINNVIPFKEASNLTFNKIWVDDKKNGKDNVGNDIAPFQIQAFEYEKKVLNGSDNIYSDGYYFRINKGVNSLKISMQMGGVALSRLVIYNEQDTMEYNEYKTKADKNIAEGSAPVSYILEAEQASFKSSSSLYPQSDKSTPQVTPNDPIKTKLNYIGGYNWRNQGQWISWDFEVPSDGFYHITFKYKQNFLRGLNVIRKVYIDDKTPFKELNNIPFKYSDGWNYNTLGDKEGIYSFYVVKGKHNLKMEATLGEYKAILSEINNSLSKLNVLYRKIVMITGINPDPFNDYFLHKEIKDLIPTFQEVMGSLNKNALALESISGSKGNEAASLYEIIRQLESFVKKPNTIPQHLDSYKANISVLADLILRLKEQPLSIDSINISSLDGAIKKENTNILDFIVFRFKAFCYSFVNSYSGIGNRYENTQGAAQPLNVWVSANDLQATGVSSGREQINILKRLVDDNFTVQNKIPVNLNLVSTSDTLLQAIVGKKAPDVALFVPKGIPISLAMRGSIADLRKAPQFSNWQKRVYPSAFIPYEYNGGIYGMPETQTFNVLFCRKDIFKEMNLSIPNTWKDFYKAATIIQSKNLQVGVAADQSTFEMMLLQKGIGMYNEKLSRVVLDDSRAVGVFKDWTDLYVSFGIPISYDFFNRFRTGEMPMGIAPLTTYNQLMVAAPEIFGLWEIAPIPASETDGKISRAQGCVTTSSIIMNSSKSKESAYQFIDWWTSTEIQAYFGNYMENIMGVAARYNTANIEAFKRLPWNKEERKVIEDLWPQVSDIPQTPASYYINRNITNAFRNVVLYYKNPREIMNRYSNDMNKELIRKRKELGLEE